MRAILPRMPREHDETVYLWLDDLREPPSKKWTWCKTAEDMFERILTYDRVNASMVVSLDHDLGEITQPDGTRALMCSGYDLVGWIEKRIAECDDFTPDIVFNVHSANPVGAGNMNRCIQSIYNLVEMKHNGQWPIFLSSR